MLWVCGLMYVLVLGFLAHAFLRHRRRHGTAADDGGAPAPHRGLSISLALWSGLIVLGLAGLFAVSFAVDRALVRAAAGSGVDITVRAQQWWWEVAYRAPGEPRLFRTANEIHLPVDTPAHVTLESKDVIHSFWVPALHGKIDLIPGRINRIDLQARSPGRYRGQCAEFCGLQHAHMAFEVVVHPRAGYERWLRRQRQPGREPDTRVSARGQQVFLDAGCPLCHAIAGTRASATVGPDLTHVGSRRTIAAGTLVNTPANLERWIEDPQRFKPGTRMPALDLEANDRRAIVAYLQSLR